MRIGILSDTHGYLDEAVFDYFAECDEIWHAGDFGTLDVLTRLRAFRPTRAVYGNVDGPDIRAEAPLDLEWTCDGLRIYMTHIGGHPARYETAAKKQLLARKPDLFLCGHSHILKLGRDPKLNLLYVNPGAAGNQGWHTVRTILRITIESAKVSAAEAVELGPRGRSAANQP